MFYSEKMEVDESQEAKEINVLILGETGVGKSTWINGLANYIQFENLEAAARHVNLLTIIPSSFSYTDDEGEIVKIKVGEETDNEKFTAGQSATQAPVTYLFPIPEKNCVVKLIDTPGIGDTRGVEQDKKNFESILSHISNFDELHAILILLKPNSARLTVMFEFCIKELLVYLHKDAARNIIFCYTNTRGTFYKPGDTLPTLKEMVKKSNLELNTKKNFCFDNEAFRFLACLKNGIVFEEHEKTAFSQSWDIATKTTDRLFDYVMTLEPHKIESTMSLNNARRIIGLMSRPMSEMTTTIVKNIETLEDHKKKIRDLDNKAYDLEKNLRVNITTLEFKELGYPRTVCTNGNCIETVFDEDAGVSKKNYRQHCHPHCSLSGIEVNNVGFEGLRGCAAMRGREYCAECGHSYKEHMHLTYDLVSVPLEKLNTEVNDKLNANRGEKRTKESRIKALDDAIKNMKEEKNKLFETSAKFGSFLKQNAILPYNDAILEYFKISINQVMEGLSRLLRVESNKTFLTMSFL